MLIEVLMFIGQFLIISVIVGIFMALYLALQVYLCTILNSEGASYHENFYPERPDNFNDPMLYVMVRKWYEVSCDHCGCAEHFPIGRSYKEQAREYGWLISKHGDFCNTECLSKYQKNNKK